jgi:hypothetical protein
MQTIDGAGCWPGRIEGRAVWLGTEGGAWLPVTNRAAEVLRFRSEVSRALADLETWMEAQQTLQGRIALQPYRDALLEPSWPQRACALIDAEGIPAHAAAERAAEQIGARLGSDEALRARADHLVETAQWLSERFLPRSLPPDAVLVAPMLGPLQLLDRQHPALVEADEPLVQGLLPLVWGVKGISPEWDGRRVASAGTVITLDAPDSQWWHPSKGRIGGFPLHDLNGEPELLSEMKRWGREPIAAVITRIDDLAAAPLIVHEVGALLIDLDRLKIARLDHPGVMRLLESTLQAAQAAGIPLLVGGDLVKAAPDRWLARGFTALYDPTPQES